MITTLPPDQVQRLRELAHDQTTRSFEGRIAFNGPTLYADEALTLIAAALTIIAAVLAESLIHTSGLHDQAETSDPTRQ